MTANPTPARPAASARFRPLRPKPTTRRGQAVSGDPSRPVSSSRGPRHRVGNGVGKPRRRRHHERGQGHRRHRNRREDLRSGLGEDAERHRLAADDEGEFAEVSERESGEDGGANREPDGEAGERRDSGFSEEDGERAEENRKRMLGHHPEVERHPDRNEEDGQENVAEGEEVGQRLVAVIGLREDQPREEGPDRQRQPELRPGPRYGEAEGDHAQQEDLPVAGPGHLKEDPRNRVAREDHDRCDRGDSGQERPEPRRGGGTAGLREDGERDHDRHDREVLEDRDPERGSPVRAVHLRPLLQDAERDHGAAQCEQRAPQQGLGRGTPEEERDCGADGERPEHLDGAGDEDRPASLEELRERELDPDREEEQDDPDLGQDIDVLSAPNESRVRSDRGRFPRRRTRRGRGDAADGRAVR